MNINLRMVLATSVAALVMVGGVGARSPRAGAQPTLAVQERLFPIPMSLVQEHAELNTALTAAGLLVAGSTGTVLAQSEGRSMESGSELYTTYCASCHGANGHGNGSVAVFLRVPPANLTQIAKRNKGVFDAEKVYRIIDGRQVVKPHGQSQMPVWGDAFMKSATTGGDEKIVSAKIRALVQYLESIQEKPGAAR